MNKLTFEIEGLAVGKQRPKASSFNGYVRLYTPKKTILYEAVVRDSYLRKYSPDDIIKKPCGVSVKISIYKQIPKSFTKKKTAEILNGSVQLITKPDIDNVTKSIFDALNQVAYEDDSQICQCQVSKKYSSENSKVVVEIEEI